MPLPDDADEKWILKEHTEVKHDILEKYLVPWVRILSSSNPRVHFFDGFAGRGTYEGGEAGSPVLAMNVANRNSELFEEFLCTFVELNENNFVDLEEVVEQEMADCTDKVRISTRNAAFEDVVDELVDELDGGTIVPSFFFIDPFGYNAMPFDTVADIINLRQTGVEVFLTFMVRDIRRFLGDEGHAESITRILGTDEWRDIPEGVDKGEEILKIYRRQLREVAGVEYVWPFEMKMVDRSETVYYLIHATNHFRGFKIMKDVMFNAGAEDRFAYLGPDHYAYDGNQAKLFETTGTEDQRISELSNYLFNRFENERLSFSEIMERTYLDTNLIEKHYRKAIYRLEKLHKATIHNRPGLGGTDTGLQNADEVEFTEKHLGLDNFT